jgi:hypothetical protein
MKLGYKFEFLEGYEFDKYPLFNSFVLDFYQQKKESKGAQRYISKLHLNSLYGIMGRKQDLIKTVNIRKEELYKYVTTSIIHSIIEISNDIYVLLISDNLNSNILNELNVRLNSEFVSYPNIVNSNVAIASAVTAYARIHMIPFKLNTDCYYSDTDSIFTLTKLNPLLLGDEIGLMKDELNGKVIKEAYFLGLKQYGYTYLLDGNTVEKSVFAGVKRDSLTFLEIKDLQEGGEISKTISSKFFRSFTNLSVKIKDINLTIKANREKKLIDNVYQPLLLLENEVKYDLLSVLLGKIKCQLLKIKNFFLIEI